jgi:DNA-binding MarR family transcriptional regulator
MKVSDQKPRAPVPTSTTRQAPRAEGRRPRAGRTGEPAPAINLRKLTALAGYLVRQAQLWVFQDFIATLAPLELRPAQYSILTIIRDNPGLSQMALSHVLGVVRSALVPVLDGLEAKGLLKRTPSASDRRSHELYLTAKGNRLLDAADDLVQEHEKRLIKKVGPGGHKKLIEILEVFGVQS